MPLSVSASHPFGNGQQTIDARWSPAGPTERLGVNLSRVRMHRFQSKRGARIQHDESSIGSSHRLRAFRKRSNRQALSKVFRDLAISNLRHAERCSYVDGFKIASHGSDLIIQQAAVCPAVAFLNWERIPCRYTHAPSLNVPTTACRWSPCRAVMNRELIAGANSTALLLLKNQQPALLGSNPEFSRRHGQQRRDLKVAGSSRRRSTQTARP